MNKIIKNTLILTAITVVSGLLLGIVYDVTKEPIAQAQERTKQKAFQTVLPEASEFTSSNFDEKEAAKILKENGYTDDITEVAEATDKKGKVIGYVINVTSHEGYGGDIEISVGIASDGTVKGIEMLSIGETAGLGMKAKGAEVTLVSGPTAEEEPAFVNVVNVCSAKEMFEAVKERAQEQDIIIKAAAVADYRPKHIRGSKMKKTEDGSDLTLELERTDDILAYLGAHKKQGQFLCGFAMETEDLIANAKRKLEKKRLDMIAANSLRVEGAGFGGNTNVVTVITKEKEVSLGKMTKEETAAELLTMIAEARKV